MNNNTEMTDHYRTLGVEPDATQDQIKTVWKRLSSRWHPDKHPDDLQAGERYRKMAEAKECLLDPIKRDAYDAQRRQASMPIPTVFEASDSAIVVLSDWRAHEAKRKSEQRKLEAQQRELEAQQWELEAQQRQRRTAEQTGSSGWKWALFGIATVAVVGVVANGFAPVDESTGRHRDPRTGKFRKGYLR